MNADTILSLLFIAGVVVQKVIRFPHRMSNRRDRRAGAFTDDRSAGVEFALSVVAWAGTTIQPFFYVSNDWFDPFDYTHPIWIGVLGLIPLAAGTWLLRRARRDLGRYWSPTLQVVREHRLVTSGVYATPSIRRSCSRLWRRRSCCPTGSWGWPAWWRSRSSTSFASRARSRR